MNTSIKLLGGLAAATLLLSSCGEKKTETNTPATPGDNAAATPAAAYPLEVCVVSGEELGSMGKPHVIDYKGTEVRFCCEDCVPKFNKDPEKYLAMIKAGKVDHSEHPDHE